jgi:hypothetical protein
VDARVDDNAASVHILAESVYSGRLIYVS